MNKILAAAAAAAPLATAVLPATAAATPAPTIGVGIQGVSGPGFPGSWMAASVARGASQAWTLKVTNNTVWAHVGLAGTGQIQSERPE
jgi:hypothetical protein